MEGASESSAGMQINQSLFGGVPQSPLPKPKNNNSNLDIPIFMASQDGVFMRQLSPNLSPDNSSNKKFGIPPSHPNNPQIMASRQVSQQPGSHNLSRGPSHSRSLSQSAIFSLDCLPPLSPLPHASSVSNQSDPVLTDVSMEDRSGGSHGICIPSPVTGSNAFRVNESLPPRRGHRRSMSDSVPLGFSAMIQSSPQLIPIGSQIVLDRSVCGRENLGMEKPAELVKGELEWSKDGNNNLEDMGERKLEGEVVDDLISAYMNLDNIDTLNSSGTEDKDLDSRASVTKTNGTESSDNEVESRVKGNLNGMQGLSLSEKREGVKRSAREDFPTAARHYRSVSMDSFIGNLQLDDESLKLPSVGTQVGQQSPSGSIDGKLAKFNLEFGHGEFTEAELKKIMANEKLIEIATSDPKRAKRILANRISAARSKERKMRYISELEQKVQTLQAEATTLSAQVTALQRDSGSFTTQNNELRFRLQAMEQQAHLKDALNEALITEVRRLRLAASELRGEAHLQLPMNHPVFQLQHQLPTQLNTRELHQQQQTLPNQHKNLQSQQQNGEAVDK